MTKDEITGEWRTTGREKNQPFAYGPLYFCANLIGIELRELLTEWHEKASLNFASRFLLKKLYDQSKLGFVRDTLTTLFPVKYFQVLPGQRIAPSKINWIRLLLPVPDRLSVVKALYEIALACNSAILLPTGKIFRYDRCIVERGWHGKQPDVRLIDPTTGRSMIVEIFYSHQMEEDTLRASQEKGEQMMEIDISSLRHGMPSMQDFEGLILEKAPRTFLSLAVEVAKGGVEKPKGISFAL